MRLLEENPWQASQRIEAEGSGTWVMSLELISRLLALGASEQRELRAAVLGGTWGAEPPANLMLRAPRRPK